MAKTLFLLALLAATFAVTSAAPLGCGKRPVPIVGGSSPIRDVKDPDVEKLGMWAVAQAQKSRLARVGLQFCAVTRGEEQAVQGTNYGLIVEAVDSARKSAFYLAEVYEDLSDNRTLTSFKPAPKCAPRKDLCV